MGARYQLVFQYGSWSVVKSEAGGYVYTMSSGFMTLDAAVTFLSNSLGSVRLSLDVVVL